MNQDDNFKVVARANKYAQQIAHDMALAGMPLISKDVGDIEAALTRIITGLVVRRSRQTA